MYRIPEDRPVLFCSNHPNAFMDALVLGSSIRRRTWFLARSDVFRKKRIAKILSFIGIIPIYRLQEGVENLSKNDETFEKCARLLEQDKAILLFSEGLCIQERRLRKLRKGTARIAFSSEEQNNWKLKLTIVPVGINYSETPWKFRKPVFIHFGEPYAVNIYEDLYRKDKPKAMNQFTNELEDKMKSLLVIIEDPQNDFLVAALEEILIPEWASATEVNPRNQKDTFVFSKKIAGFVNDLQRHSPGNAETLRKKVAEYADLVRRNNLRDWLVRKEKISAANLTGDLLVFILGFGISLFGILTNYFPYKIPWLIQKKIVRNIEWSASVNATLAVFLWQFYWLLQSAIFGLIVRDWFLLAGFMLAVPLCGMFAQWYWVRLKKFTGKIRWNRLSKKFQEELVGMRKEIVEQYDIETQ